MSFVCINRSPREAKISSHRTANKVEQRSIDHVAEGTLRMSEMGCPRSNPQVAQDGQIKSAGQSHPVHRCDDGKRKSEQRVMEPVARVPQPLLKGFIVIGELAQIEPSTEGVAFAGHDEAIDRVVRTKVLQRIHHLFA